MASCFGLKSFGARLQRLIGMKPKTQHRPSLVISSPFDFRHETGASLPGVSDDEVAILKEKAAASCMGNAPRRAPVPPPMTHTQQYTSPPPPANNANMF